MQRGIALPALIMILAACSDSSSEPTPAAVVTGCYTLALGTWSGPREAIDPPDAIVLMDSLGTDFLETGKPLVRPLPGHEVAWNYASWWDQPTTDSLVIYFTTGYVGVHLRFRTVGPPFHGRARAVTDVAPPTQAVTSVTLASIACP